MVIDSVILYFLSNIVCLYSFIISLFPTLKAGTIDCNRWRYSLVLSNINLSLLFHYGFPTLPMACPLNYIEKILFLEELHFIALDKILNLQQLIILQKLWHLSTK